MGSTTKLEPVKGAVHLQRFAVAYEYPVHFTEFVFDPANPVLVEALARHEPERRHRCVVFVDDGLLEARPGLGDEIVAYARHHAARMELVAAPFWTRSGWSPP
jgi:3-dehydroquinate synthase